MLDLSEGLPGPYAAALFAAYGARVIKVERPLLGDVCRTWPPFAGEPGPEASLIFQAVNAGKLSLTLDYETEAGAAVLRRLAEDADAIIEDGPTKRSGAFGLDDAALIDRVPRLVIARVVAPAGDDAALAGNEEMLLGLHAFAAALAALWRAAQTEHGQVVDVEAADALASTPLSPSVGPLEARGLQQVEHPGLGLLVYPPPPFELEAAPATLARAPLLGEHTEYVLHDLIGWDATAIEALRQAGTV